MPQFNNTLLVLVIIMLSLFSGPALGCDLLIKSKNKEGPRVRIINNGTGSFLMKADAADINSNYPYYVGSYEFGTVKIPNANETLSQQDVINVMTNLESAKDPYFIVGGNFNYIDKASFYDSSEKFETCLVSGKSTQTTSTPKTTMPIPEERPKARVSRPEESDNIFTYTRSVDRDKVLPKAETIQNKESVTIDRSPPMTIETRTDNNISAGETCAAPAQQTPFTAGTSSAMIEKMNMLERENRALRAKLASCNAF